MCFTFSVDFGGSPGYLVLGAERKGGIMNTTEIALRLTEATLKTQIFPPPVVQFVNKGEEFNKSVDCFRAILSILDRDQELKLLIERNNQ